MDCVAPHGLSKSVQAWIAVRVTLLRCKASRGSARQAILGSAGQRTSWRCRQRSARWSSLAFAGLGNAGKVRHVPHQRCGSLARQARTGKDCGSTSGTAEQGRHGIASRSRMAGPVPARQAWAARLVSFQLARRSRQGSDGQVTSRLIAAWQARQGRQVCRMARLHSAGIAAQVLNRQVRSVNG
jgi:hypothetical protein